MRLEGKRIAQKQVFARFNSKLVRLEDIPTEKVRRWAKEFQFQTGSIKRLDGKVGYFDVVKSFNSKLVRLKDYGENVLLSYHSFQFQTGSIKSIICRIIRK